MSEVEQPDGSAEPAGAAPRLPWWMTTRARLPILLACLAAAGVGLAESRAGLFSAGGSANAGARTGCPPRTPPLMSAGLHQIAALRLSLLPMMAPLNSSRYASGPVPAEVAWTDNPPQRHWLSSSQGPWPASYEMRVWVANRDDVVADVFLFATGREAAAYFAEATSPRCHQSAREMTASRAPGGRNLVWTNPDGPTQQDLFLLRGPRVYRIGDVRARRARPRAASVESGIGLHVVNTLGCVLADAGCLPAGTGA